jgi:hypothetical protein
VSTLTPDRYRVVFHDGDWKIKRSGGFSARYRTQRGEVVEVVLEGIVDPS